MSYRDEMLQTALFLLKRGKLPTAFPSEHPEKDQAAIHKKLSRRGIKNLGTSTDKEKGFLWFRKK